MRKLIVLLALGLASLAQIVNAQTASIGAVDADDWKQVIGSRTLDENSGYTLSSELVNSAASSFRSGDRQKGSKEALMGLALSRHFYAKSANKSSKRWADNMVASNQLEQALISAGLASFEVIRQSQATLEIALSGQASSVNAQGQQSSWSFEKKVDDMAGTIRCTATLVNGVSFEGAGLKDIHRLFLLVTVTNEPIAYSTPWAPSVMLRQNVFFPKLVDGNEQAGMKVGDGPFIRGSQSHGVLWIESDDVAVEQLVTSTSIRVRAAVYFEGRRVLIDSDAIPQTGFPDVWKKMQDCTVSAEKK